MNHWLELEKRYYMQCTRRQPILLVRGEGTRVWDEKGMEYLDFTAGWGSDSLGHCHPEIVRALEAQARTLLQTSNQFYTLPQLELAQLLVENSCLDRVFFCNSGAEANEGAVKLARKYGELYLNGACEVITARNSFHGRTLAMTAATGQEKFHRPFTSLDQGFVHVEFNDIEALRRATTPRTCAVMLEPVQGEGGVHLAAPDYWAQVRAWCDERGILLILDEVQTGMGRLGSLFGYQKLGVEPDILTLAKGLGGGVPIGAIMARKKADLFQPGDHGSTFGGNALTCAAACVVVRTLVETPLLRQVEEVGAYLGERLHGLRERFPFIREVRGMGLLWAVEFQEDISDRVVTACNQEGLLLNPVKPNAVRLFPPLTITREEVDQGLKRLERALEKVYPGTVK